MSCVLTAACQCIVYVGSFVMSSDSKRIRKVSKIDIRCTEEQKEHLRRAAEEMGYSLSTWMLALALRETGWKPKLSNHDKPRFV